MKPLEGLKVVELGMYISAPGVARLLADWGAEVTKVEAISGDKGRVASGQVGLPMDPDCDPIFSIINSGKKLLSMDLKSPEGLEIMHKLLADADFFVTNTRYGGLTRLGLDYETLHEKYPKLIYCYINGYGLEGEEKDKPGFDMTCFWARSGILNALRNPGDAPRFPPPGIGDMTTANAVTAGLLAALYQRTVTGEGSMVSSSLLAAGIWSGYAHITGGQERPPLDPKPAFKAPIPFKQWRNPFYHIYNCKDGRLFFLLGGAYQKLHTTFHALGMDDLIADPNYKDHLTMQENSAPLYDRMIELFKTKTADEWAEIFTALDAPYEILSANWEVSKDQQAWANGCFTHMECPNGSTYIVPNTPVQFSTMERTQTRHAGGVGRHTEEVLASLGYTPEQIADMMARQVVTDHQIKPQ